MREYGATRNEDPNIPISERQMLDSLSRMSFVDMMAVKGGVKTYQRGGAKLYH